MNILIKQSSTYVGDGRWNWAVWLAGERGELDAIDHVIYTLHPSFPNPIREIRARRNGFRLTSSGWGEFRIYIEIFGQDGPPQQLSHDLKLEKPAEAEAEAETVTGDEFESVSTQCAPIPGSGLKGLLRNVVKHVVKHKVAEAAEHEPVTTVFVSGGVADSEAVRQLSYSLEKFNVNVLSTDAFPSGMPVQAMTSRLIAQADLSVFLISGRPSLWLSQEIEVAKREGKPIVPVLIGSEAELPTALSHCKSHDIQNLDNLTELAKGILGD